MTTKFKKRKIQVHVIRREGEPPRMVDALVLGDFAVHRGISFDPYTDDDGKYHDGLNGFFVVTHVPTGLSVTQFFKQRAAKTFIHLLSTQQYPPIGDKLGEDLMSSWTPEQQARFGYVVRSLKRQAEAA